MSCDVGKATESLENEQSSFSKLSVSSPTSQLGLILQAFRYFTYVTTHSPTLPLLHLRHSSFSNPFFRLSYVTGFSLTSPGAPSMTHTHARARDGFRMGTKRAIHFIIKFDRKTTRLLISMER